MTHWIASPMSVIAAAICEAFRYPVPILCPNFTLTSTWRYVTNGNINDRA